MNRRLISSLKLFVVILFFSIIIAQIPGREKWRYTAIYEVVYYLRIGYNKLNWYIINPNAMTQTKPQIIVISIKSRKEERPKEGQKKKKSETLLLK
jgi:hypothetical protein